MERRLEQQRRQHDVKDQIVGQRQAGIAAGGGERRARKREADCIGQTETPRRERDQNGEAKQAQCTKDQSDFHAPCLAVHPKKRNRGGRR